MSNDDLKEEQEARAKLRESYLKHITKLIDKKCTIVHYEKKTLNAVFSGTNSQGSEFLVTEFETPIAFYKSALLRAPDVLSITFNSS